MSTTNFGRSSTINFSQTSNQKTLIYDLRSQLSNLKSQFSRLINKSGDQTSKSKVQYKTATRSRYNQFGFQNDNEADFSSPSQSQISSKYSQITPSYQFKRPQNKNQPVFQKLANGVRKNSAIQQSTSPIQNLLSSRYQFITKPNQIKKQDQNISAVYIKKHQQANSTTKKVVNNVQEALDKTSIASKQTSKDTAISYPNNGVLNQQLNAANQRIKKLQQENKGLTLKNNTSAQHFLQLEKKHNKLQKDFQQSQNKNIKKDEKVQKLENTVRQLNQRLGKNNQVTTQIGKQKQRQIQILKQNHYTQIANQKKDFQKRLTTQKQNIQQRYEGIIKNTRQSYQLKLGQIQKQKQKLLQQIKSQNQNADKMKINIVEVQKQKFLVQNQLKAKVFEITRQNQTIRILSDKQVRTQNQFKQKISALQKQLKQKEIKKEQQKKQSIPAQILTNNSHLNQNQTVKQLQDKLNLYLSNIDKQSQKLKDLKTQLDKSQRLVQQYNRIICQKDVVIRNLMKDCKILEKDSSQSRKAKRQAQIILQQSNQNIIRLQAWKLGEKYKDKK